MTRKTTHRMGLGLAALAGGGLAGTLAAAEPAFWLVKSGEPRATIVIATNAPESVRFAAGELRAYVEKLSGARLPLAADDTEVAGAKILLGRSRLTDALNLAIPDGFTRELREEGYLMKTAGDVLVLAGNDGGPARKDKGEPPAAFPNTYKGTLFAVYDLLERFGCRWYFPGAFGELVPKARDLGVPALDATNRPAFPVRGYWYGLPAARRKDKPLTSDMNLWMLRCRYLPYGSVLPSAGDGSVMGPFTSTRTEKGADGKAVKINTVVEEHPEYFAIRADGSRNPHYLCLANPDVVKRAAEHAADFFRKNPGEVGFGLAPPDGAPTCECPACKAANLGLMQKSPANPRVQDISEGFYRFLNEVALLVKKEFPDKWITTTAYSGRIRPPEATALADTISAHVALLGYSEHHRFDFTGWQTRERVRLYERWGALSRYTVDRPYYPPFQFHCHAPQFMPRALAYNVRRLRDFRFAGSEWEGRCAFFVEGLNTYVMARCLWNPDTDVEALLGEFYVRFFGPAAAPVRALFEGLEELLTRAPVEYHEEERLPEIYPLADVARLTDAAGDFEALAGDADPATRQRVRFARLVADHLRAYSEMRRAEADLDFQAAADKARLMIEQEREADAIHPALIDGYAEDFDSRSTYGELGANGSPHGKLKQYLAKQALVDGTRGRLAAALPEEWAFTTDPRNEGLIAQWYLPGDHGREWKPIRTTRCWEAQGYQDDVLQGYDGYAWYRVSFTVPESFRGQRLVLFVGGLNEAGWFWCNGRFAGFQPFHEYWQRWKYHHEVDLTSFVTPGQENTLVVRVFNEQSFGGLFRRSFVYAPKE